MEKISNLTEEGVLTLDSLIENSRFIIHETKYAEVDSYWPKMVSFYPHYRLYYVTHSEGSVLYLKDKEVVLEAGKAYFIPAFQVVSSRCESLCHHYLHFLPFTMVNNILDYFSPSPVINADDNVLTLFKILHDNYLLKTLSARLATEGAFKLLLSMFFKESAAPDSDAHRFLPTLNFIDKNICGKITLADLAETLNLEQVYFANLFKRTFGVPPIQYVINKKIDISRTLLMEGAMNIKEISEYLGFESELYFSRLFKKKTMISPTSYRKVVKADTILIPDTKQRKRQNQ